MWSTLLKHPFWLAAGIAAVLEAVVIYQQWPPPPLKICASIELGALLAAAAKAEGELHEVRALLRKAPDDAVVKEVMRMEAVAAAASNEVAIFKQRALEKQRAGGAAARDAACS